MPKSRKFQKGGKDRRTEVVRQRKLVTLRKRLHDIYAAEDLSTVCCRQCTCCRVMCPQMKYSEADNIIDRAWNEWNRADKKALLVSSVRYFFSDSLVKPCLLLDGVTCRVYEDRPLNCRLYGMWPAEEHARRVERFCKSTGLPADRIPLNVQCPNVRRSPVDCSECKGGGQVVTGGVAPDWILGECPKCGGKGKVPQPPLTKEATDRLFAALDGLDAAMGMSDMKIKSGWNYRTLHDWVLLKFWGEDTLVQWTNMLIGNSQEERDEVLKLFEDLAENIL